MPVMFNAQERPEVLNGNIRALVRDWGETPRLSLRQEITAHVRTHDTAFAVLKITEVTRFRPLDATSDQMNALGLEGGQKGLSQLKTYLRKKFGPTSSFANNKPGWFVRFVVINRYRDENDA